MDLLWLVLLAFLALLPPVAEYHKQLILLAFGLVQLGEGWAISRVGRRGPIYVVLIKIVLATLLIDHTGEISINSSYWPIYFLPVVTAAEYFSPWATLGWTALTSAAYCSYLFEALQEYEITVESYSQLAIRILFFFLAGTVVNRFVVEAQRQTKRYQELAETLAETNRRLEQAQAEARRSERLAALGQLSAGLAHEIRNPLGVIKGSAEMLTQKLGESNPLATELAGYISTETNRLSALVTRFLDFARPLHTELAPQDITAVLDRALNSGNAENRARPRGGSRCGKLEIGRRLGKEAVARDSRKRRFLFILVRCRKSVTLGRKGVEVRIEDTGPGVPMELREQIFNPFVTTKKTGVGLGLSIVSKVMDGHHGSIRVESAGERGEGGGKNSGARFVMFFPAAHEDAQPQASSQLVVS